MSEQPAQPVSTNPPRWQSLLANAVTDATRLLQRLGLADSALARNIDTSPSFPVRVPEPYLARMTVGDPDDPLLRQVLSLAVERSTTAPPLPADERQPLVWQTDPLAEEAATAQPGVLQKYLGRALLITAPDCAVHCRYCFRRHFPYEDHAVPTGGRHPGIAAVAADPSISEVILSGGDPLMLKDAPLRALMEALAAIPHVTRIRIHTRLPVVIPQRLTPDFELACAEIADRGVAVVLVLHVNHANEVDPGLQAHLQPYRFRDITLLNQAVLLRGVNDTSDALCDLSEALFSAGVLPYYLHALDPVVGVGHFAISDDRARDLIGAVRARLPGYLVPRLVRELAGEANKTVLL